jgi:hypothetical protein
MLQISLWQNEHQWSINNVWLGIMITRQRN